MNGNKPARSGHMFSAEDKARGTIVVLVEDDLPPAKLYIVRDGEGVTVHTIAKKPIGFGVPELRGKGGGGDA